MATKQAFTNMETAAFCDQMALILKSGISSIEGINVMLDDTENPEERAILQELLRVNEETGSFYQAVSAVGVFPEYMVKMVRIGEEAGKLDDVMQRMAANYAREDAIQKSIKSTITYPLIMIAMMLIVIVVLLVKVMPIFNEVFLSLGTEMGAFSQGLMNIGTAIRSSSIILVGILVVLAILGFLAAKTEKGRKAAFSFGAKFKGIRKIIDDTAACRFAGGLALTLSSGLNPDTCIDLAAELNTDERFAEKIAKCKDEVACGGDMAKSLQENGIFTGVYSRLTAIGQKTGNIDESLDKIAQLYQDEIDMNMNNVLAVLEPTIVVILSIIVGIILLSVMLPLIGIMAAI